MLTPRVLRDTCFQRATRRMAHCLFVVALRSWSWYCFRRVVAIVSEFRHVCLRRGLSLSRFFHGGGAVGVTLYVGFERSFLEGTV